MVQEVVVGRRRQVRTTSGVLEEGVSGVDDSRVSGMRNWMLEMPFAKVDSGGGARSSPLWPGVHGAAGHGTLF